jgi:gamma-resorcylate decarboxylase
VDDVGLRLASIEERVKHMDAAGVAISAVSLTMPGTEGIFDTATAVQIASKVNDQMHELYRTGPHVDCFLTWGCVAMQDHHAAAKEAERCVKELGCWGILINGYSNLGSADEVQYLDEPQCDPFWAKEFEFGRSVVSASANPSAQSDPLLQRLRIPSRESLGVWPREGRVCAASDS